MTEDLDLKQCILCKTGMRCWCCPVNDEYLRVKNLRALNQLPFKGKKKLEVVD